MGVEKHRDYGNKQEKETVALVKKAVGAGEMPTKREEFVRIHAKIEMEKDAGLVTKLARDVLEKSAQIDERVTKLPGMHRTKTEQMKYIQQLIEDNKEASDELEKAYAVAVERRAQARRVVTDDTSEALGLS